MGFPDHLQCFIGFRLFLSFSNTHLYSFSDSSGHHLSHSHNSFTDVCELLPGVGGADLCNPEALASAEVHRLTSAYVLAFARRVLYEDQGSAVMGLLDGTRVLSAEAALTSK